MPCRYAFVAGIVASVALTAAASMPVSSGTIVGDRAGRLTRETTWKEAASIAVRFNAYHPQGLVKVDDALFVSSVEIQVRTRPLSEPHGRFDRDAGLGNGHLFKIDMGGNRLADLRLGEGSLYHPGGLDYGDEHIWVPVAEYRPNSRSVIYRIDPKTMKAAEVLRIDDHIGAVAYDSDDRALHGVSWGSRRFYRWTLGKDLTAVGPPASRPNPSHYVDYQDCKYVGRRRMLCTGVAELRRTAADAPFRLGGLDLIDLADGRPLHQVPIPLWTAAGLDMTHNASWLDPSANGLRAYFMPEDGVSRVYVYEVALN